MSRAKYSTSASSSGGLACSGASSSSTRGRMCSGATSREQQRGEVEVLVGELALARRARPRARRRGTSAARRRCPSIGRPMPAPSGSAAPGAARPRVALERARRARVAARASTQVRAASPPPRRAPRSTRRRRRCALAPRRRHHDHARRRREVEPERGGARRQRAHVARSPSSASSSSAERTRALLVAGEVAQPLGRRQQRHRGLRGGAREPRREHAAAAGDREPAGVADRHRHDVPAVVLELALPTRATTRVGDRRRRRPRRAVGVEHQHAGVEHAGEPLDHRLARPRLLQRVDQVALDRGQALVGVQVAGEQRAVDEADDVPERRARAAPRAPGTSARGPRRAAPAARA